MSLLFWLAIVVPAIALAAAFSMRLIRREEQIPWFGEIALWLLPIFGIQLIVWGIFLYSATRNEEYWTHSAVEVSLHEGYWELKTRTVTETDSKGNVTTRTETYWDYNWPYWRMRDSDGNTHHLSEHQFVQASRLWGDADPPRNHDRGPLVHVRRWNGDDRNRWVITTHHGYTDRTLADTSIYSFRKISQTEAKESGLHEWPGLKDFYAPVVLGSIQGRDQIEQQVQLINADFGRSKQIRVNLLIWHNASVEIAELQRHYWRNGKKNELNICMSFDGEDRLQWCRAFSWSESEELKAQIAHFTDPGSYVNWDAFVAFLRQQIESNWQRKQFKDFSYLSIEMPLWSIIIAWLASLGGTGILIYVRIDWNLLRNHSNESAKDARLGQEKAAQNFPHRPEASRNPKADAKPRRIVY